MKQNWISFLLAGLCLSCMHSAPENAEVMTEEHQHPVASAIDTRKLVKKAAYRFEVADASKTVSAVQNAVTRYPAIIADSKMASYPDRIEHVITVRIEAPHFEAFLNEIDREPKSVDFRTVTTTDFTKEFVDLEARLATKREVLDRFTTILRDKTGTVEDVLAAERQIGQLQEEIESAVSRLNYLKDQVAFSTITLEIYQTLNLHASVSETPLGEKFANAFRSGLNGITQSLIVLTHLWPLLIAGITAWLVFVYRRRIRTANNG